MVLRRLGILTLVALGMIATSGAASAQYEEDGFFLFLDAMFATPRDTDQVFAVEQDIFSATQTYDTFSADWGSDPAGRIEFGYRWPSGSKVSVSYWSFDNDQRTVADGEGYNFMNFAIGPYFYDFEGYYFYGDAAFGYPGHLDIVSAIKADTIDISWGHDLEVTQDFDLEWSVGVRFASFEETIDGLYDYCSTTECYGNTGSYFGYVFGDITYAVDKTVESDMAGIKAAVRGTYYLGELLSVNAGMSFSFLDGEVETSTGLTPVGAANQVFLTATSFNTKDDDRSGNIREFDVNLVWHIADDRYRAWLGYEHSTWDGLPKDLARNTQQFVTLNDRSKVAFSGFKIGFGFLF